VSGAGRAVQYPVVAGVVDLIPGVGEGLAALGEIAHYGKDLSEIAEYLDGFLSGEPIMSAVIRGRFAKAGKVGQLRATTLGLSVATTKYPNVTVMVSRQAFKYQDDKYPPFSGPLSRAWARAPYASPVSTANPFGDNPYGLVNNSERNGTTYASGKTALDDLLDDTAQIPAVDSSMHTGGLVEGFDDERGSATAPACSSSVGFNPVRVLSQPADETICWRFNDGDA
jgi:hypothetical protein